jgi:hypothetical protein
LPKARRLFSDDGLNIWSQPSGNTMMNKLWRELLCAVLIWWTHMLGEKLADAAMVALLELW